MKKLLLFIFSILLTVVVVAGVVVFAFEKEIPAKWVSGIAEQVKEYKQEKFDEPDDIPNESAKLYYEKLTYTKKGNVTETTITSKEECKFSKSGSGENLKVNAEISIYSNNGKTKTTSKSKIYMREGKYYQVVDNDDPTEISASQIVSSYEYMTNYLYDFANGIALKDAIKSMLENNLVKVTQKGLCVKFHLENDNISAELSYNLVTKKIAGYKEVEKTYDSDNNLVAKETFSVVF